MPQHFNGDSTRKSFEIRAQWDGETGVWWCSNDELPLTTEAPTFERVCQLAGLRCQALIMRSDSMI
ncbi:MAG: DUF1902 domain-containing protein [Alphaproteobacteria bacterium]|nr:DUF1902 domain-containing protein [Alphaproteobacteria bacterium]